MHATGPTAEVGTGAVHQDAADLADPGIRVDGVTKRFGQGADAVTALHDVSVEVANGEFVTVIGPSGCGKSTLLRVVAGLLQPDGGSVSLFGESPEAATLAKRIGFVPQAPALLPWRTVVDNVRLPLQVNKRADHGTQTPIDPVDLLESFGLGDVVDRFPAQISGGMQQRVAIARAFVFDPTVLLMDEPFAALDEMNREAQRHVLLDIWQRNQKTILFVTHSIAEAVALSDRIVVMSGKPGTVASVIDVDLPRPRTASTESTSQFHALTQTVRHALHNTVRGIDD